MDRKKLMNLVWGANFLTKLVYGFLAWQQYNSGLELTAAYPPLIFVFLGLGIVSVGAGLFVVKELDKRDSSILNFYTRMSENSLKGERNDPVFGLYTVGLGLIESSALFGLVSFMITGNIRVFLILAGVWLVGWVFAKPSSHRE